MAMCITDPRLPDNPVVFVNDAFCRLTGYERAEIMGRNCRFLQGPSVDQAVAGELRAAVRAGQPLKVDVRNYRRNGEAFWNRLQISPVHGADGGLRYFLASQMDVTVEREQLAGLKNAHRDSEAKFHAITDSIDQMVWSALPDGFHDFYNQRWYDFTGVPAGSTDGEAWNGVFHPEDQDRAWSQLRHSFATGENYEIEYRLRHRSGVYRWVLGRAVPQRDKDGAIVRWFGTCTDIQEIVEAREVLARSRMDLERQVAERTAERDRAWRNSQDLLCVIAPDGVFEAVNPAWTALLGWPLEEVAGRHHLAFSHPDDRAGSEAALARAVDDRLPAYESRILHKDGSYRWFAWVASSEGGMAYASGRHITAEKEAAAALARAEEQLRQSQKMEAVGQLTGGIAHDFNNLLTGILGALALMERRIAEGRFNELHRYASVASASASRASALTQRLLAFARRQPLDPKPMDANRLLASMEDLLRRTLGPSIELEMVLAGGLWPTMCDLNQLENAILNLAINARDAITGAGRLTLETANAHLDEAYARSQAGVVKPGQYVAISVTDTGSGMDAETAGKAFEPFFTTKPIGQGTGLGLSMLYGFVRQSGGHVQIYTEPSHGTTFRVYLPRHYGSGAPVELSGREAAIGAAPSGKTILVVDDEPAVRMVIAEILEGAGYGVIEAVDGASALLSLRQNRLIDLLVTDVGLPAGFNGRQLADAARTMRPELKVLFITGFAGNAAIGHGMLEPGMEILTKPFAMEALATKVRVLIDAD